MQCKDIPDLPVLIFLASLNDRWGTWFDFENDIPPDNSVVRAMPDGTPQKLARAKMAMLIRRGLVDGCSCGCRGDYMLTNKAKQILCERILP